LSFCYNLVPFSVFRSWFSYFSPSECSFLSAFFFGMTGRIFFLWQGFFVSRNLELDLVLPVLCVNELFPWPSRGFPFSFFRGALVLKLQVPVPFFFDPAWAPPPGGDVYLYPFDPPLGEIVVSFTSFPPSGGIVEGSDGMTSPLSSSHIWSCYSPAPAFFPQIGIAVFF